MHQLNNRLYCEGQYNYWESKNVLLLLIIIIANIC